MAQYLRTALALAWVFLQDVLVRMANSMWDALWEQIFLAVAKAERDWEEAGAGAKKKEQVVAEVMAWLDEKAKLSFVQRIIARFLVGHVVDALVAEFNARLGKDWVSKAKEIERKIADLIPVID